MVVPIIGQISRVVTKPIFGADGDPLVFVEAQSYEQVDQVAKTVRYEEDRRVSLAGNTQRHWRKVADIPNVFVNKLMREGIWNDPERREEWLKRECPRDFLVGGTYS